MTHDYGALGKPLSAGGADVILVENFKQCSTCKANVSCKTDQGQCEGWQEAQEGATTQSGKETVARGTKEPRCLAAAAPYVHGVEPVWENLRGRPETI